MKLLGVILVFALCIGMSMSYDDSTRQLFAINGPLYVDSASLRPAILTSMQTKRKSTLNTNNRIGFTSLQARNLISKLLSIVNDDQTNLQLDTVFTQNQPTKLTQNDVLQKLFVVNQNPYTQSDALQKLQLDQMHAQNDQVGSLMHNLKINTVIPHERIVRIFTVPIVKSFPAHDVPQTSQLTDLDQLNAQIDYLHQLQLDKLNGHAQNDVMQWQQNQQLLQQNPYTLNDQQFGVPVHQFDQIWFQNDLMNPFAQHQHTAQNLNDIVAAQNFQNNPVAWQVPIGLMSDENQNDQLQNWHGNAQGDQFQNWHGNAQGDQFQNWQGNFQGDQFQNWHGNAQGNQFQNWHGNIQGDQLQSFFGQQQNGQRQEFGMGPTISGFGSSDGFFSEVHSDDYD